MEKLKFNPDNKKYYSNEFIKGFECGVERQFNADMEDKTTINSTKTTITEGRRMKYLLTISDSIVDDIQEQYPSIEIIPIKTDMFVNTEGFVCYLQPEHVEAMRKKAEEMMMEEIIDEEKKRIYEMFGIDEKEICRNCNNFMLEGWSHCMIHENCYDAEAHCNDFERRKREKE